MKISFNNHAMYYSEHGSRTGSPVVFIHGFPFSHAMWEPQMRALPHEIRALTYDVRGHGLSDVGDGQFTIEHFVDDLIALLDHLAIEKAVLCGLSMGGYIALRTIERQPERVSGLILCDTKSEPDTNEAKIKRTASLKMLKTYGVQTFAEHFVKAVFWEKTFQNNPDSIEFIKRLICANSVLGIGGTLLALAARTDTTHLLSSIQVPTCLIGGDHDALTPPSVMESLHTSIAGSVLHILPDAGHMSNLENTTQFNTVLFTFLKKHW